MKNYIINWYEKIIKDGVRNGKSDDEIIDEICAHFDVNPDEVPHEIIIAGDDIREERQKLAAKINCLICDGSGIIQFGYAKGYPCKCTED